MRHDSGTPERGYKSSAQSGGIVSSLPDSQATDEKNIIEVEPGLPTCAGSPDDWLFKGGYRSIVVGKLSLNMPASFVSLTLARFDTIRKNEGVRSIGIEDVLFSGVAADTRAAAAEPSSQEAFKFVLLGLHASEDAARELMARRMEAVPWFSEATEVWSGALRPVRHTGAANFLDKDSPGPIFGCGPEAAPERPIVILTTAGFNQEGDWRDRATSFGFGVAGVRMSMTATPGLHTQQTFFFPGGMVHDGLTVTFWKDFAAARDFAYGPGVHQGLVKKQKSEDWADRTSFTRCVPLASTGVWHGRDPLDWS